MSNKEVPTVPHFFNPATLQTPPSDAKLSHVQRSEVMALTFAIKELKNSIDRLAGIIDGRNYNGMYHHGFNFSVPTAMPTVPLFETSPPGTPLFSTDSSVAQNGTCAPYFPPTH